MLQYYLKPRSGYTIAKKQISPITLNRGAVTPLLIKHFPATSFNRGAVMPLLMKHTYDIYLNRANLVTQLKLSQLQKERGRSLAEARDDMYIID